MPSSTPTASSFIPTKGPAHADVMSHHSKIGIGVGASIGGLALVLIIGTIYFLLRRRQRKKQRKEGIDEGGGVADKAELPNEPMAKHQVTSEKYSEPVYEMADSSVFAELGEGEAIKADLNKEKMDDLQKVEGGKKEVGGTIMSDGIKSVGVGGIRRGDEASE
jgi:hypothetical protein